MKPRNQELINFKRDIRTAIADYISSKGCGCCAHDDNEAHEAALGKMLNVKKDESGYDFSLYRSKKV